MKEKIIEWIKNYFTGYLKDFNVVVGLSGGVDSTVTAALLVEALGKDRVIGVLLPQGEQHDINCAKDVANILGIKNFEINIKDVTDLLTKDVSQELSVEAKNNEFFRINTPPRIRMTILYGVAALNHALVANTCNRSEDYVGYSTKYGDSAGDFSLLSNLVKSQVREVGKELNLPEYLINKIPEDGLSGKSDEEKLGFTYEVLDKYILTCEIDDSELKEKIDLLHERNLHKITLMPSFKE